MCADHGDSQRVTCAPGAQLSREIRVQCSMLAGMTYALDAFCHFLLARWARASPSKVSLADAQDLDSRRLVIGEPPSMGQQRPMSRTPDRYEVRAGELRRGCRLRS
jgi:hypothetical protein